MNNNNNKWLYTTLEPVSIDTRCAVMSIIGIQILKIIFN